MEASKTADRPPLPTPDHPGAGIDLGRLSHSQTRQLQTLMSGYWRLLERRAELLDSYTNEDRATYCEQVEAWQERAQAFKQLIGT